MLFTKATLDFVSAVIFSASLGIGVMLAACFVLVFEGAIVLLAQGIEPFLSDYVIGEMTCVGSILIIALGLNMLGVTKLKIMNYLPAILMPVFLCFFMKEKNGPGPNRNIFQADHGWTRKDVKMPIH